MFSKYIDINFIEWNLFYLVFKIYNVLLVEVLFIVVFFSIK